jgi:N-acetylglucosamine repressor
MTLLVQSTYIVNFNGRAAMAKKKATHQRTKQHNRDLVLRTVFDNPTISRADIARATKLTRATVSDMVANLIDEGLVEEVGYGESIGGKLPILLSLVPDSRFIVGLNLAQDRFIGAIVNLRGEIKETVEIPVTGRDGQQALQLVYQILDQLVKTAWKPIVGIGVGTPGLVHTQDSVIVNAVNLDWQDLPLANLLEDRYKLPVSVMNDSQANAIGEFVYGGKYESESNLIVLNLRHGIGAGILINGRLYQGDGGGAGEIGHLVVQENGRLCRCGSRGCLETVASANAVVERAKSLVADHPQSSLAQDPENITLAVLETAYKENDPLAQQVVNDAASYLGSAIANLIATLNIREIILTGDMACFGAPWLEAIKRAVTGKALAHMVQDTRLEIGQLENRGCILGASAFMLLDDYSLLYGSTDD